MLTAAIYHRPESEDAYLIDNQTVVLRLRSARDDLTTVSLLAADPYTITETTVPVPVNVPHVASDGDYDYWQITVKIPTKRLAYAFVVTDGQTTLVYGDQGFNLQSKELLGDGNRYFRLPYFHDNAVFDGPDWVRETVWYQIFPERFANGNPDNDPENSQAWQSDAAPGKADFYGGDLQGIIDHLDYLAELGISGLYLTPVFAAPSNHKYDTTDYFSIDPAFGDLTILQRLVAAAHQRGMRVMLDAVFNHIGDTSPLWQDVVKYGAASRYADWFHIQSFPVTYTPTSDYEKGIDMTYETFSFTPHMPKWRTENPEVTKYLIAVAAYWMTTCDIDAWRLDVANEVDHHFWRQFRTAVRAVKPDVYVLGEVWHTAQPWLDGTQFDGVMNYTYTQLIKDFIINKTIDSDTLKNELTTQQFLYPDPVNQMLFNLLDSHDTPRILTQAKGDKNIVMQAMAMMFMQTGTPSIYYGTEAGLSGGADPDNRRPMNWEHPAENPLFNFVKKLIQIRKTYNELLTRSEFIWETPSGGLIFSRGDENQVLTLVLSVSEPVTTKLTAADKVVLQTSQEQARCNPGELMLYIRRLDQ
jgi:neopullulanase